MGDLHVVADRAMFEGAVALIASHGEAAAREADVRAARSRDLGNHILFTRWRRVARMIALLADRKVRGRLH